jgi:hypothetical protein
MISKIDGYTLETVIHSDNSVHRRFICSCGKVIYKKNLTTGEYTLAERNYLIRLLPGRDQGEYTFPCDCGQGHIVLNIKEGVFLEDEMTSVDKNALQN